MAEAKKKPELIGKQHLLTTISTQTGVTKTDVGKVLDALADQLHDLITHENTVVRLPNIGSFKVIERQPRQGRDPRTGAPLEIPAKKIVRFSPAATLSSAAASE